MPDEDVRNTERSRWQLVSSALVAGVLLALLVGQYVLASRVSRLEERLPRSQDTGSTASAPRPLPVSVIEPTAVTVAGAPRKGSAEAPVALLIYSDFLCPYCRVFATQTLPDIEREFVKTGKLAVVFKQMPLESLHKLAPLIAKISVCANERGQFWRLHDALFKVPRLGSPDQVFALAGAHGMARPWLTNCLGRSTTDSRIADDAAEARSFGMTGTPAFLLGGISGDLVTVTRRITGAQPTDVFRSAIAQLQ